MYWLKSVCVYEHSLREGVCRRTAAASDSCVINIRTSEGGRDGEREREAEREREGAELERMGGAALLRNAEHHISGIVEIERERERER